MRLAVAILSSVVAATFAFAEPARPAPKAKPAKQEKTKKAGQKAKAAKEEQLAVSKAIADSYNAIPLAERLSIQSDLVWTGDYNGLINGDFGARAVAAVKAFQKRNGGKETGVLNQPERAALSAAAKPKQEAVGWRIVDDLATGARIGIPAKLMPNTNVTGGISRWSSARGETSAETFRIAQAGTTLPPIFERMKKEPAGRRTEYGVLRDDFFVISGLQNLKKFYVRAQLRGNEVRGITILYDQAMAGIMEPVVVAMSSAYAPFPSGRATSPPPRRLVEYASGVAVAPGTIVTSRDALDGCYVVTVAGVGGADRIAEDKTTGLALLRVHGANLAPVTLAGQSAKGDVTLLGVADPQAQGGGAAVSAARARVSDTLAIEPAPVLGFDGAAVLDAQGRLAGIAALNVAVVAGTVPSPGATAALLPVEAIRTLMTAQRLTPPASAATGAEAAKGALVRVICVRK
jgi:peptidoglycan hydrolase-like protein with peptidoglycan-binding domain